jgi:hypothetical protein
LKHTFYDVNIEKRLTLKEIYKKKIKYLLDNEKIRKIKYKLPLIEKPIE